MQLFLLAAALSSSSPSNAELTAEAWGQSRLDRVVALEGLPAGAFRFRLSDAEGLLSDEPSPEVRFAKTLLFAAKSTAEVDGLLAVIVSARTAAPAMQSSRRPSLLSTLAYSALIAATGGASDPAEGKGSTVISLGPGASRTLPDDLAKAYAFRAAAWNERLGHCMDTLTSILKVAARVGAISFEEVRFRWGGDPLARSTLKGLGMLASPTGEKCPAAEVADLNRIQAGLASDIRRSDLQAVKSLDRSHVELVSH